MLQKFKITFYALIVLFVLSGFSSQDVGIDKFIAESCAGWNCTHEGQVCPQGAKGASDKSFICRNSKWVPILAGSCKGWNCTHEGQLCPEGAEGARGTSFICLNSQWVPTTCTERNIMDLYNKLNDFMSNTKSKNYNIGKNFSEFVYNAYDISIEKMNIELFYQNLIQ